jgi:universal stress protein A
MLRFFAPPVGDAALTRVGQRAVMRTSLRERRYFTACHEEEDDMLSIRTILHPTDFSERSKHAFRFACSLAQDYRARLIVLHVWPPPPAAVPGELLAVHQPTANYCSPETEAELHSLRPADPSVDVEHRLAEGDAATVILETADSSKADLIVVGTHGRTGLSRILMGSVAEEIVRGAVCPVVTVKTPTPKTVASTNAAAAAQVPETMSTPQRDISLVGAP